MPSPQLTPKELHERLSVYLQIHGAAARQSADEWMRRAALPGTLAVLRPQSRRGIPRRVGKTIVGQKVGANIVYDESKEDKPRHHLVRPELLELAGPDDLHATMRRLMTDDHAAITLGKVTRETAEVIGASLGDLTIPRLLNDERRWGTFCDMPTHVFVLDMDRLPLPRGMHAIDDWGEIASWIGRDILPEEFGEVALGFYPTAKAGLVNPSLANLRITAWLKKPLPLAHQAYYVTEVLQPKVIERCREWAGYDVFDPSIYSPQAYIFTAKPRIIVDGQEHPDPFLMRYLTLSGNVGLSIDIDPAAVKRRRSRMRPIVSGNDGVDVRARDDITRGDNIGAVRSYAGRKIEEIALAVRPGNTQIPVLSIIAKVAIATPNHRTEEAIEELGRAFLDFVPSIPGDQDKLRERLKETVEDLPRKWESAVRKFKYNWADVSYGYNATPRVSLQEGRDAVARIVWDAIHGGLAWRPDPNNVFVVAPHTLVNATLGVGKTEALISALRDIDLTQHRIHVLVPTDRLGQELLIRLRAKIDFKYHDHHLRQHRGRTQPGMCINEDHGRMASDMEEMGFSPWDEVCKRCPSHGECPWARQHDDRGTGIVIRTHSHLQSTYRYANASSEHAPNLFVIDESPLATLLTAPAPVPIASLLPQGEFETFKVYLKKKGAATIERAAYGKTADWRQHRQRWHDKLQAASALLAIDDFKWLQQMTAGELDEGQWVLKIEHELREHINRRLLDLMRETRECGPDVPKPLQQRIHENKEQRRASLALTRLAMLIRDSANIPGRARVFGARIVLSGGYKSLSVAYTDGMPDILRETPTLILDATAGRDVQNALSAEWNQLQVHEVAIAPGAYDLTLVGSESFSRSSLKLAEEDADLPGLQDEERVGRQARSRRKTNRMAMLHRAIYAIALENRNLNATGKTDVLVLCQKGVDEAIRTFGPIPRVDFLSYGNVRGLNEYRDTRCIVAIGRATPGREILEQHAETLHAKNRAVPAIELSQNWIYGHRDVEMADGSWMRIISETHPDPVVESYRRQIVDAEVIQGIGRGRIILRDAANPIRLIMFGQTDVGLPIHRLASKADFGRSVLEIMTERGIIFERVSAARVLYGELISDNDRNARDECAALWTQANAKLLARKLIPPSGRQSRWEHVTFRLRGSSQGEALLDMALLPSAAKGLVDALGPRVRITSSTNSLSTEDVDPELYAAE